MTISSSSRKAGPFIGNGSASVFAFSFRVFAASDLEVVRIATATGVETTLTINSGYTVSLNADQNSNPGGSITLVGGALASGQNLIITSNIANLQPTDLTNQGGFYPEVITDALDRATIQIQQLDEHVSRTLAYPITDPAVGLELPSVALRANKFLSFDENGEPVAELPSTVAGWQNYQSAAAASATAAAGSAATATSQASTATTQAGLAAAQAAIATAQAATATTQAVAATAAKTAAEAARDVAAANANVYASTAAGLSAVALGQQFMVLAGNELVRYRHDAGPVATEVARYPTASNVVQSRPKILPFMASSMVLEGAANDVLVPTNRDIVAIIDTELNALGIEYAQRLDNLAIVEDSYGIVPVPSPDTLWKTGNWVAVSVFVKTADWTGLDPARIRPIVLNRSGGAQTMAPMTQYDEIRADLRRYHGVFEITSASITDANIIWVEVTGTSGRSAPLYVTGYMGVLSQGIPGGIDWREALREYRRQPRFNTRSIVKSVALNGNLNNGAEGFFVVAPPIAPITHTILNGLGITNAVNFSTIASLQNTYFQVFPERTYRNNNWFAASVLVQATDWDWLTNPIYIQAMVYRKGYNQAQLFSMNLVETLASDLRRYAVVGQMTQLTTDLDYVLIEVRAPAGRTATVRPTGYACGFSEAYIDGVDWLDFDPFYRNSTKRRLDALDSGGAIQSTPDLLIASTYHVLQGRPLELYAAGLTGYRETARYDIAAAGQNGNRVSLQYASPVLALDGNRYNGSGFFYAKRRGADDTDLWQRAVNFVSSAATKTGSPKVLMIGDSLTAQGVSTALKGLLQSAGMTPSFVGTFNDTGGTLGEGRSSYEVATFLNARRAVNVNETGQIKPVRTGAGSGATFAVTRSANVITAITVSGGTGYDDNPALPLVISGGAGGAAYATVAISGGVPGAVTIINGGSGYTSDPTVTMPPTVSEYLTLSQAGNFEFGPRWEFNPFIRPTVGGDSASLVKNGYVFDVSFYLSRFSLANPDFVLVGLGTNDVWKRDAATALAQVTEGMPLIYSQIRAALPSAKIGIVLNSMANLAGQQSYLPVTRALLGLFNGREAENIFVLPAFQAIEHNFSYAVSVATTDAQTGMQTAAISDSVHPTAFGRSQHAEMLHQFIVARS